MAADDTPAKSTPAPKPDSTAAKSTPAPKADSTSKPSDAAAPSSYSRGEGQKSVTQIYRDNWNAIFGKPARKKAPARGKAAKPAAKKKVRAAPKKKAAATTKTTRGRKTRR